MLTTARAFCHIFRDQACELTNLHAVSSELLIVQTRRIGDTNDAMSPTPAFYNPFIASLITSYARKKITSCMNDLGPMFLYTDTGMTTSQPRPSSLLCLVPRLLVLLIDCSCLQQQSFYTYFRFPHFQSGSKFKRKVPNC